MDVSAINETILPPSDNPAVKAVRSRQEWRENWIRDYQRVIRS